MSDTLLRAALLPVLLISAAATGQNAGDSLERGFQNPPDSARPRVWWHWMNGNISKEGIKLDLEWMKRVGLGGFQNFDAALATPQIVPKRLVYMTPEWKDAFRYAATLADQLGLEMAIAGSPGWSESGGPWVPPAQAMKKFVWSETRIDGGRPFTGALPKPPTITGPFQNIPRGAGIAGLLGEKPVPPPQYYADTAVVAYRAPDTDRPIADLQPKVTSSGGQFNLASLTDGDLTNDTPLPVAPLNEKAWVQFEFPKSQAIHALTLVVTNARRNPFGPAGETGQALEASDDGQHFRTIVTVPGSRTPASTLSFPEVTARFFRVTFQTLPQPKPEIDIPGLRLPEPPRTHDIAELALHPSPRVNRFEDKAAFSPVEDLYSMATPPVEAGEAVSKDDVIDLTAKMRPDGTLDWTPPEGRWVVLRMGYSLLGITNHPASPEATGPEVDKLSRPYVKAYLEHYLDMYKDTVGPLMGKRGLQYVVTDSWEAGAQNWTDDMPAQFQKRRGYDMHPWMPVLAGRVVQSAEASDRFLWDFRRTIAELTAENHYDQIGELLHQRGMGRYSESHESGRALIADGMEVKRNADIPMSATWVPRPGEKSESYVSDADVRESASVAHIYGQNLVAAESLTAIGSPWQWSPETLKPTADKELSNGLNRFVIHTSVHQPVTEKAPGLGLGPFGQWFTRLETWAEQAKPWVSYLSRSSYMLQQGKFVADVLYFYGEDSNVTALFEHAAPAVPAGYSFDYCNADALIHRVSVADGRLTTPSGMSYRVLALDRNARYMSLPVLRKIRDLVNEGAAVVGARPEATPSLSDDPEEFARIAGAVWGGDPGKGKVFANEDIGGALSAIGAGPDFTYTKPRNDMNLLFVHRRLDDGDIYWVDNRNDRVEELDGTFRVSAKAAEFWRPQTGRIEPAAYRISGGSTTVPLRLEPYEAIFVVFRKPAASESRTLPRQVDTRVAAVSGPWEISFQPNRGAPPKITLDQLASWSDSADDGVKYFSGTAAYAKTIDVRADWFQKGARLWLDLGDVKNLAEVLANGRSLGIVWKHPFRVDVTDALHRGANQLQVKVTNLWVNRLIGDQQPGAKKYTYTTMPFYRADSPLFPSGLLGPVEIVRSAAE